ncbi:methyltransferase-like protein, putative [Plasmodium knowlesi strain H]|uniref:Methyltransferase-like protein, putative n=3 Tax=Plasmodium knowlesi TaxID=5850 RepID=A0A5K1V9G2_PLAKH|nr:methyltransferase, putative [Plasmodium knowlesi strain H]OTN63761.1 putative Methyl transferase-like protein [Plasmodium knowlesi]CAA9990632.1 methyltransferase, putative [Plasmodium knowlesi strain H]SBO26021.1 methyltransferase-like protein, putative [Plasmodium knowlesi strain H]SBO28726.1 methyltransferase-like protein, putative [Plasmodium knowlesi strain H]VVS80106.1 methyltransferase, putative [Plasmodium knowlesi strain H]|eukprot:XP_002261923.1 methyl transferase-like protein, putative [Plasmodium knowlesi strain H]
MESCPEVKINFHHIYSNQELRKNVYLPSSDTFTFLEALEEDVETISPTVHAALEMGTGSGYLILSLYELLLKRKKKINLLYCLDINEKACKCVRKLTLENKISNVEIINTDLFSNLKHCKQFDLVLFNPPYVVTEEEEMNKTDIVASYAGGKYGREIILKFLLSVYDYVSDKGVIYLLMEKNNRPNEILNDGNISSRFNYTELKKKKTLNETIFIYKLSKKGS